MKSIKTFEGFGDFFGRKKKVPMPDVMAHSDRSSRGANGLPIGKKGGPTHLRRPNNSVSCEGCLVWAQPIGFKKRLVAGENNTTPRGEDRYYAGIPKTASEAWAIVDNNKKSVGNNLSFYYLYKVKDLLILKINIPLNNSPLEKYSGMNKRIKVPSIERALKYVTDIIKEENIAKVDNDTKYDEEID